MAGRDNDHHEDDDHGGGTQLLTRKKIRTKKPSMYRVVMLNDDYTPMDFVVWVLQKVFHKALEEATHLMLEVHNKGKSIVGRYTHDVARTKVQQVHDLAERNQHPLQCILEVEEGEEGDG